MKTLTWQKPGQQNVAQELIKIIINYVAELRLTSPNAKAASKSINSLYKKWGNDKSKQGYGKYAKTNVNEFWAEVCTKAVHGKADKYTKAAKDIIKKYKL